MSFNRIKSDDIKFFSDLIPKERLIFGDEISPDYSHDELGGAENMPELVIRAMSTEEVSSVMRYANEHMIPVVARGSGSGLVGAAVPMRGGIVMDLSGMKKILELDEDNLTVTVEPGVLLMELAAFAEEHDLMYPPDPGEKSATLGGNISTNAGGMRAVKYGVTRDYVRGLTVVLPTGDVVELGGKVVKNSSGYALKDLMIGSEGTLGIITRAILKLVPKPAYSVSLLIPFPSIESGIGIVPELIKSKASLTAIEFMQREVILFSEEYLGKKFPDNSSEAYILLTFDGMSKRQVDEEYEKVAELCLEKGAIDVFIMDTDERKQSVWSARSAFLEAIKASTPELDECDVVVPRDRVAEFINYTHEVAQEIGIRIPSFGHAGDGNLHVYVCRDELADDVWHEKLDRAFKLMYKKAEDIGGLVSGEHGIGWAKRSFLKELVGDTQMELMRGIKKVFDPNGILNPDKVIS